MILQVCQRISVQPVLGHCIAHQKHLAAALIFRLQRFLRSRDGAGLQPTDSFGVQRLLFLQLQLETALLGPQSAAGGSHAHPLQPNAQPLFQPGCDGLGQTGHLLNIVDLPIHHGSLAVLGHLDIQHLQPVLRRLAHNAHNAARPDIQGIDQVFFLGFIFCHINAPFSYPSPRRRKTARRRRKAAFWPLRAL